MTAILDLALVIIFGVTTYRPHDCGDRKKKGRLKWSDTKILESVFNFKYFVSPGRVKLKEMLTN